MKCAYRGCAADFQPDDPRQRYCCPQHKWAQANALDRHCKNCKLKLETPDTTIRFCNNACRWSYLQRRKQSAKRVVRLPIAVLLPAGCSPHRVQGTQEAASSTIGSPGMVHYGDIARRVFCARYERCLAWVVSQRWGNWDCVGCDVDETVLPALRSKRSNYE